MNLRSGICSLANRLWMGANLQEHRRFCSAMKHVAETQEQYLMRLLAHNARTQFGVRHAFIDIRSVKDFQERVPIADYEAIAPYFDAIAHGEQTPLTADPVRVFQPTSGTSAGSKFIPYTQTLQVELKRVIAPWIVSLFSRKPDLMNGPAYWSITPPRVVDERKGTVPVRFEDDAQYLGRIGHWLHRQTAVTPNFDSPDCNDFQIQTLIHLLAAPELRLISVWSPTFLSLLLEYLLAHWDTIIEALAKSSLSRSVERAREIRLWNRSLSGPEFFSRLWPRLGLISCWMDGPSNLYAERLRQLLPHVEFQGKGLIATEAFVSFPFRANADPALAVRSHFFEFMDIDSRKIYLAHQLASGKCYSVIVTTGGGLYRYRLNDVVEVTGAIAQCPTLRFVGRAGMASDLFGEKLSGVHVQRCAERAFAEMAITPRFYLLAPIEDAKRQTAYTLFLDAQGLPLSQTSALIHRLEMLFRQNFHYDLCRQLGQLSSLRLFLIDGQSESAESNYVKEMQRRGQQLGNIKPISLDSNKGWDEVFKGEFTAVNQNL